MMINACEVTSSEFTEKVWSLKNFLRRRFHTRRSDNYCTWISHVVWLCCGFLVMEITHCVSSLTWIITIHCSPFPNVSKKLFRNSFDNPILLQTVGEKYSDELVTNCCPFVPQCQPVRKRQVKWRPEGRPMYKLKEPWYRQTKPSRSSPVLLHHQRKLELSIKRR